MFTTIVRAIERTVAATATPTAPATTTTTPSTTTTGRFSGNWKVALIVVLGVFGLSCLGAAVTLVRIWLKRKVQYEYVSSIQTPKDRLLIHL